MAQAVVGQREGTGRCGTHRGMSPHPEADALGRFRATRYATGLGHRNDRLFETLDAVRTATAPGTLARLRLAPGFPAWGAAGRRERRPARADLQCAATYVGRRGAGTCLSGAADRPPVALRLRLLGGFRGGSAARCLRWRPAPARRPGPRQGAHPRPGQAVAGVVHRRLGRGLVRADPGPAPSAGVPGPGDAGGRPVAPLRVSRPVMAPGPASSTGSGAPADRGGAGSDGRRAVMTYRHGGDPPDRRYRAAPRAARGGAGGAPRATGAARDRRGGRGQRRRPPRARAGRRGGAAPPPRPLGYRRRPG